MSAQQPASSSTQLQAPSHTQAYDPPLTITIDEFESLFLSTLNQANQLSKHPFTADDDEDYTHEIAMAKMLNYCIRMLHSDAWNPRTVVRAMAHLEDGGVSVSRSNVERTGRDSVKGVMYRAMREMKERRRQNQPKKAKTGLVVNGTNNRVANDPRPVSASNSGRKEIVNAGADAGNGADRTGSDTKSADTGNNNITSDVDGTGVKNHVDADGDADGGVDASESAKVESVTGALSDGKAEAQ